MRTLPSAVEHHVRGLQIAVNDAAVVRRREARAELPRDVDGLVRGEPADAPDQRGEVLAVDVLHREEAAAVRLADVVHAADVRVRHLPRDAELVVELREAGRRGAADWQKLQRNRLVEREIVGPVDFTHAAPAEERDQPIASGDNRAGDE